MKKDRIVLCEHFGINGVFEFKTDMEITAGDILLVDTANGDRYVRAITSDFEIVSDGMPVLLGVHHAPKNKVKERTIREVGVSIEIGDDPEERDKYTMASDWY